MLEYAKTYDLTSFSLFLYPYKISQGVRNRCWSQPPTWGQCYKTFYGRNLLKVPSKLECLSTFKVSHLQTLEQVRKACQGQTLQLTRKFVNYGYKKFYNIGPWGFRWVHFTKIYSNTLQFINLIAQCLRFKFPPFNI